MATCPRQDGPLDMGLVSVSSVDITSCQLGSRAPSETIIRDDSSRRTAWPQRIAQHTGGRLVVQGLYEASATDSFDPVRFARGASVTQPSCPCLLYTSPS